MLKLKSTDVLLGDYEVLKRYGIDYATIPFSIPGQAVEEVAIRAADGTFLPKIRVGKLSDRVMTISQPERWHANPIVNYVSIRWFLSRISNLSPSNVMQTSGGLLECLENLAFEQDTSEKGFGESIRQWAVSEYLSSENNDWGHKRRGALKSWLEFAQLEVGYGIDERIATCLIGLNSGHSRKTRGMHVLTLDDVYGPFTAAQRVAIENALQSGRFRLREEALVRLHRFLGLRPAQTALLRESDLVDEGGCFLDVPLVKEKGAAHRRRKGAFRRYKIPIDVADSLRKMIADDADNPLMCPIKQKATWEASKRPMFKGAERRIDAIDKRDAEYYWHFGAAAISSLFYKLTQTVHIQAETSDMDAKNQKQVRISAYRFRYSVGTLLAQNGASLRQIAQWLGHKGEESVRFYLKMADEWWEHDRTLSSSETQQKAIASLHGALVDRLPKTSSGEMASCIAATGYCVLPAGVKECPYDPMRSCASCANRRDHAEMASDEIIQQAIDVNEAEIAFWQANSTASIPMGLLTEREKHADVFSILSQRGDIQ